MLQVCVPGDCRTVLKRYPDGHFHCVVTSPPYWGMRDYGSAGEIGSEIRPTDWVAALAGVFKEVSRTLRDDGVLFLNLGESYVARGDRGVPDGDMMGLPPRGGGGAGVRGGGRRNGWRLPSNRTDLAPREGGPSLRANPGAVVGIRASTRRGQEAGRPRRVLPRWRAHHRRTDPTREGRPVTAADPLAEAEAAFLSKDRWRDPVQHLTLADWLEEHGRPREAAMRRINVELWEDRHRLDFAGLLEREAADAWAEAGAIRCHCRDGWVRSSDLYDEDEIVQADPCPYCDRWRLRRATESDAARAEFIRVQVELARVDQIIEGHPGDDISRRVDDAAMPLRRRESELLDLFGPEWSAPVAAALGLPIRRADNESNVRYQHHGHSGGGTFETPIRERPGWSWRRGFVAALTLTAADLMRHAAGVFAAQPIEEVTLSCRNASPRTLSRVFPTWFANRDRDDVPNPADSNWLPWSIAIGLGIDRAQKRAYPRFERYEWQYDDCRSADTALSTAAVAYGRAAAHLPPLPVRAGE